MGETLPELPSMRLSPELPAVRLDDEVHGADDGDRVSIEARYDGGLPLLWIRTKADMQTFESVAFDEEPRRIFECVALDDEALLKLAALCVAHYRARLLKRPAAPIEPEDTCE